MDTEKKVYLATAEANDEEMKFRIKKHKKERDKILLKLHTQNTHMQVNILCRFNEI